MKSRPLVAIIASCLVFRLSDLAVFWWVERATGRTLVEILMSWDSDWYLNAVTNGYAEQGAVMMRIRLVGRGTWIDLFPESGVSDPEP